MSIKNLKILYNYGIKLYNYGILKKNSSDLSELHNFLRVYKYIFKTDSIS